PCSPCARPPAWRDRAATAPWRTDRSCPRAASANPASAAAPAPAPALGSRFGTDLRERTATDISHRDTETQRQEMLFSVFSVSLCETCLYSFTASYKHSPRGPSALSASPAAP